MPDQVKPALYALTPEQHASVIAALHYYHERLADPLSENLWEGLATKDGTLKALDAKGVAELYKGLDHTGLTFGEIVPMFAESSENSPYVRAACETRSGEEFEVDDPAVVSHGDDDGAYVMGWTWISDAAAGVKTYWTIQIGGGPDMPLHEGGSGPDEPVWYFEYEDDFTRACDYCAALGLPFTKDIASKVPEDDFTSDFGEFKEYADLQAKEDSHG